MRKMTFIAERYYRINYAFLYSLLIPLFSFSQTTLVAEISGNPPDLNNWTVTDIDVEGEEIVLTNAAEGQNGAIFFSQPYNLNQCEKWRVEFDFRIYDGVGDDTADGMAFWYLENPPTDFEAGNSLGMPQDGNGLKVCFDTYNNDSPFGNANPELQVYYGEGYNESTPEPNMLKQYLPGLRSNQYQHAEISWDAGNIEIVIDDVVVLSGNPQPFDQADEILQGYFGFSASTGLYFDRHSIKNVQVFIDAIQLENDYAFIELCDQNENGYEQFDLTSAEDVFSENGNFSYYTNEVDAAFGENPIAIGNQTTYTNSNAFSNEIIYVRIENDAGCYVIGELELQLISPPDINTLLINIPGSCDLDHDGYESYDLTQTESQFVDNPDNVEILYFETQTAAQIGDPSTAISVPNNYLVQAGATRTVFVRIGGACYEIGAIVLSTYATPEIISTRQLTSCDNSSGAYIFDLAENNNEILGNQNPINYDITYHTTQTDADAGINEILNVNDYQISSLGCEMIYVRMENSSQSQCYETSSFEICAVETSIGIPISIVECATAEDGLAIFDLSQNDDEVLDNQAPSMYTVSYFTTMPDAETGQNAITTPSNYQAQNQVQTLYVRVENNQDINCYQISSFEIESIKNDVVEIDGITECGNANISDYDLTEVEINFDQNEDVIGYFTSEDEAFTNTNQIINPTIFNNESGTENIFVRVEDEQQRCFTVYRFSILTEICEPFIPEGFSPNGDGVNDVFEISGLSDNYPNFSLKIFSRYGRLIYEGNRDREFWNGTSDNGNQLPSGTYYYILEYKNIESDIVKGWVYLNK